MKVVAIVIAIVIDISLFLSPLSLTGEVKGGPGPVARGLVHGQVRVVGGVTLGLPATRQVEVGDEDVAHRCPDLLVQVGTGVGEEEAWTPEDDW